MAVEPPRAVTLRDVASLAGVSTMSVSRVLSGKQQTSAEMVERVRAAIAASGYRVNKAASNLRQGRRLTTIALVVDRLDDPYFAKVISAAQAVAAERGALLVVTGTSTSGQSEDELVSSLLDRSVDGILLYPSPGETHDFLAPEHPVVLMGRSAGIADADAVLVDNESGAHLGVSHLLAMGHRRIGLIDYGEGPPPPRSANFVDTRADRIEGYRRAHREAGVPVDAGLLAVSGPLVSGARAAALRLAAAPRPPTAFFSLNSRMTVGVIHAFGSGLQGYGLVGIDDFELADVFEPPVTVVTQDPPLLGTRAARLLFDRLEQPARPFRRVELPMELIVRGSGRPTRTFP